eukprot:CAMPEP_0118682716 /NCGR_PEP_ID=MMETSP0800-20121206/5632_1 /TAXON_ID=210618 ORGANISM="Striatella unipunctata, Strain CCMP2910" /NCGR_SAMPLE_ID=MMETSP0800 /ASSEMBLY_ACC=CAM_ASM_000638 /LENGTH=474 /DNA_ID=CAMNT_0006579121 /DNA_START=60 /DNA_END=1484 /DNA_ORIENTATION=-
MTDGIALCLTAEQFNRMLGPLGKMVLRSQDKHRMLGVPTIAQAKLSPVFRLANKGENIKAGLYILREGKVAIERDGDTKILSPGSYFGEDTLVSKPHGPQTLAISKSTITLAEDSILSLLPLKAISTVINPARLAKRSAAEKSKASTEILFQDVKKLKILGAGTFGQVWLVSNRKSKEAVPLALKIQSKRELINHHQVKGVMRERKIMGMLDHPFIIKLHQTFQDDKFLYLLMDMIQGGELFTVIHSFTKDGVKESQAQFYAAGVLEALAYFHSRHIVYRDLKPENVLIDRHGYPVLIDLGFAKVVMDKTYTLCGTPLYLAPEVILSRGHNKAADYWSWAVMVYEMISGVTPFLEERMDQITLFKRITRGKFYFPQGNIMSSEVKELISRILIINPSERLGSFARGAQDIKDHHWFNNLDFKKLLKRELRGPWIPKIKNALDVSNFDSWDHLPDKTKESGKKVSPAEQQLFDGF